MSSDISLTPGQRLSLLDIQQNQRRFDTAQTRLSSGLRLNTTADDPVAFFKARALSDRANDYLSLQGSVQQAVGAIRTSLDGIEQIDKFLDLLEGIVVSARSASNTERLSLNNQFGEVLQQIDGIANDAVFQNAALLNTTQTQLRVNYDVRSSSQLNINGIDLTRTNIIAPNPAAVPPVIGNLSSSLFSVNIYSSNGGIILSNILGGALQVSSFTSIGALNTNLAVADATVAVIANARTRLRAHALDFGSHVNLLQRRLTFIQTFSASLNQSSDTLKLADLNEEGALFTAAQTRRELALQALTLLQNTTRQAILRLF